MPKAVIVEKMNFQHEAEFRFTLVIIAPSAISEQENLTQCKIEFQSISDIL
jgi:hypothetical protein